MLKDILWWIWLVPLAYFVFRFKRQYSTLLWRIVVFMLGFRFGLRWVDWIRTMGSRDWIALLDRTPIGADAFRYTCAACFGLAAIRVVQRLIQPYLPPTSPPGRRPPGQG